MVLNFYEVNGNMYSQKQILEMRKKQTSDEVIEVENTESEVVEDDEDIELQDNEAEVLEISEEEIRKEYEKLFNKKPYPQTKIETMLKKIEAFKKAQ